MSLTKKEVIGYPDIKPDRNKTTPEFSLIRPQVDKATFVRPADFVIGRVEFGFGNQPADAILVANVSGIANGGPTTQVLQLLSGATRLADSIKIFHGFVGGEGELPFFADELTGAIPTDHLANIAPATTVPDTFKTVQAGMENALEQLKNKGMKNIVIVSNGYTAFAPFGVKKALETVDPEKSMKVKFLMQDSSYPDTDNPVNDLTPEGFPTDRFNPDSYQSNGQVEVIMLMNNWVTLNPKWPNKRAPKGTLCGTASFPFSPEYVKYWESFRLISKQKARNDFAEKIQQTNPKIAGLLNNPEAIFIPLIASSGYFDRNNVGKWMTSDQFDDMRNGCKTLIESLSLVAKTTNKPVLITGTNGFTKMVEGLEIGHNLFIATSPIFKQSAYGIFLRSADLLIHRTTQANTMAEAVIAGIPSVVLTMPSHGYMDVDKIDSQFKFDGGRQYFPTVKIETLAEKIQAIATDPGETASIVETQYRIFYATHKYYGTNFFTILAHLAGIPLNQDSR